MRRKREEIASGANVGKKAERRKHAAAVPLPGSTTAKALKPTSAALDNVAHQPLAGGSRGVVGAGKSLGAITRELRRNSALTLKALAAKTGMALSTLSKVENDQMSLTYDKLVQLANGLDVDVARLFDGGNRQVPSLRVGLGRRSVNRLGEGKVVRTSNYSYLYLSTELSNRQLIPMIVEVLATSPLQFSDSPHHPGEEFAYILEGELELYTEFYEPLVLRVGESISYESEMRHAYVAKVSPCRVLVIGSQLPPKSAK